MTNMKKTMENLQIKIIITDGLKETKTTVNVNDYLTMKELHGVSLLDLQVDILLEEIQKNYNNGKLNTKNEN